MKGVSIQRAPKRAPEYLAEIGVLFAIMDLERPVYISRGGPSLCVGAKGSLAVRYDRIGIVVRHAVFLRKPDLIALTIS